MKKLNITKKRFCESKYFTTKYGKLAYVSESGNLYKTSKGQVLKFAREDIDEDDLELHNDDIAYHNFSGFSDLKEYIERIGYDKEVGAAIDGDGRLGSVLDEGNIIEWLVDIFKNTNVQVIKPKARNWYDVELKVAGKSYFTNIKTTAGGADNISSKTGVWYYLSGGEIVGFNKFTIPDTLPDFNKSVSEDKDYFLLVMYKNSKKILFTSLGRVGILVPNFSN